MNCDCDFCKIKDIFYETIRDQELNEFCSNRIEKKISKGSIIINQGESINDFIYLKEGLVKLFRNTPMGEQIISMGKPKDFVSLLSVFASEKYSYSVQALDESVVCILNMDEIKSLITTNGAFAMSLITTLNKASESILFNYLDMSHKRLAGRVASVLLYFSEVFHSETFELPITRKEIAQLINMSSENVIRTISDFRRDNIINVYGKRIHILNKDMLIKIKDLN